VSPHCGLEHCGTDMPINPFRSAPQQPFKWLLSSIVRLRALQGQLRQSEAAPRSGKSLIIGLIYSIPDADADAERARYWNCQLIVHVYLLIAYSLLLDFPLIISHSCNIDIPEPFRRRSLLQASAGMERRELCGEVQSIPSIQVSCRTQFVWRLDLSRHDRMHPE
jgi:hypothetical protein